MLENNPNKFADLDKLCIQSNNVYYNDFIRDSYFKNSKKLSTTIGDSHCKNQSLHPSGSSNRDRSNTKTCFLCNKPGHLAKNCWSKNKTQPKN